MSADRINYVGSALAALDQALNTEAMLSRNDDDWDFTVERAVWRAQRAGNTFTEEDIYG